MDARIRRRLRLRDLDTLIAVAETGSMARAAARLAVSQPAVSKAIAEMERTLGYRLLDRTAQGVEPNLYGRALLKWAKAVFDDVHQGVAELDFISDPTSGELRVAATGPIVAAILPVILERMRRRHPSVIFTSTRSPRSRSSRKRCGSAGWICSWAARSAKSAKTSARRSCSTSGRSWRRIRQIRCAGGASSRCAISSTSRGACRQARQSAAR